MLTLLTAVWRWRRLVKELARREFHARYAGSALGAAWAVLEPAVQFGLYLTVFSYFLGMRLEGRPDVGSFGLYLVSGLVPFLALQEALSRATSLVRGNAGLVRHVNVPIEVLLAGSLLAVVWRYAIALGLVLLAALALGSLSLLHLPWLIVGVALLLLGVWGAALLLATAGAFLPDLAQVVGTAMMVLFFLTPVVYTEHQLPSKAAKWLVLNPLLGMLEAFRAGVIGGSVSSARLALSGVAAVAVAVLGSLVFVRRAAAVRDLV